MNPSAASTPRNRPTITPRTTPRRPLRATPRISPHAARLAAAALADHQALGDSFMGAWTLDELDGDDLESVRVAWSHSPEHHAA